jgi:PEP-CTERM motif
MMSAINDSTRRIARIFSLAVAVLFVSVISQPVLAAQINYGSHMGTNVTYVNVTEDSGADEPLPLFGSPTVTGNSIDFNPTGFDAESAGADSDITDSNLVFMVTAKSGSRISKITLSESGDTTLTGNVAPGSMGTASAVFASGVLDIHEVNFMGINHISVPFSFTFNPSGGTYFLGTDGGGGPSFATEWNGSVMLDIDAILAANGIVVPPGVIDPDGGATKISIDMDNTLVAVSQVGTRSRIAKKDFSGVVIRSNVPTEPGGSPEIPEPATFVLVGLSVLGLGIARRSR